MKAAIMWLVIFWGISVATGILLPGCSAQGVITVAFPGRVLETLSEWERIEQIRDWVVYSFFISHGTPPEHITLAFHDFPPIRQHALSEVHDWQYGAYRWTWMLSKDETGLDLYCFLPEGTDNRVIGYLADDFRRLTGHIPTSVYLVTYTINEKTLTASFSLKSTFKGTEVFRNGGRFGYREREIRNRRDLELFLKEIDTLTYAKVDKGALILGGRDMPEWRPLVDLEDIATLYQAYLDTDDVGFSLDPAPFAGLELGEYLACVLSCTLFGVPPEDCPYLCLSALLPDWVPQEVQETVSKKYLLPLHRLMKDLWKRGTEESREAYKELASLLGRYVPQCPRYDGDIAGTKVGMTLFYCDLLAKLWGWNFENSTPREIGMLPELELPIAEAYWKEIWELPEGRLWFDLDYPKIRKGEDSLFLSPWSTRLFAAISDPEKPGEELPPRNLPESLRVSVRWWNAHWAEIMKVEPQYRRLNEIHKWSALIAWLKNLGLRERLGFLKQEKVTRDWVFPEWLERNRETLAFKDWLPFVGDSEIGEGCLSIICSEARPAFGAENAFLSGGVSLATPERTANVPSSKDWWELFVQQYLKTGMASIIYQGASLEYPRVSYVLDSRHISQVTPGPQASFRSLRFPYLRYAGGIQGVSFTWRKTLDRYEYSADWKLGDGHILQEKLSFKITTSKVEITFNPSASPQLVEVFLSLKESGDPAQDPKVDAILSGKERWELTEGVKKYLVEAFKGVDIEFIDNRIRILDINPDMWPVLLRSIPLEYVITITEHTDMEPVSPVPFYRDLGEMFVYAAGKSWSENER